MEFIHHPSVMPIIINKYKSYKRGIYELYLLMVF